MIFPSEPGRRVEPDQLQQELWDALNGHPRLAPDGALYIALNMLQAQIASRRAIVGQGGLTTAEVDDLSRQIQGRVEKIRGIVAELRARGRAVEWAE